MKSLVITSPGKAEFRETETAKPGVNEVLVKVKRAGICGSDIHIYKGSNPFARYPRVIGHELAGEVVQTGPETAGIERGDRVVVNPVVSCGACDSCQRNHPNVCQNLQVLGVHRDGGFSSHIRVKRENLYSIPKKISWDQAVLVEPFSIGANISSRLGIRKNDRVLIIGAGAIGSVSLMVSKMLGAKTAISDINPKKLAKAKELGADFTIHSADADLKEAVNECFDNQGATAIIDAACVPSLFQTILECAAPGGRVGLLGFSQDFSRVNQYEITRKELSLLGSRLNNNKFPLVLDWFMKEQLNPELIIKERVPFSKSLDVLHALSHDNSGTGKTIITFDS